MVRTPPIQRLVAPFAEFARTGALGGIALLLSTAVALFWANSPWAHSYHELWGRTFSVGLSDSPMTMPLHAWINDGLMAVFFLVVGLEIKRELMVGELSSRRQAALPLAAALGGMVVPALIYTAFNWGKVSVHGWGVPMATDIAFALGILALLGSRVPLGLKVFLAALAIVDDLGAVLVIALFYTSSLEIPALVGAFVCMIILSALNKGRVLHLWPYILVGCFLWYFILASGVHATVAGVLMAFTIPAGANLGSRDFLERGRRLLDEFEKSESGADIVIRSRGQQDVMFALDFAASQANAPLLRLEHALHGVVSYGVLPIFALANAGVTLGGAREALQGSVAWGVIVGLFIGKFVGITAFSWASVRWQLAALPEGVSWGHMRGTALLGGIGFTMALFIASLAYTDSVLNEAAKIGILIASVVSGVLGFLVLRFTRAPEGRQEQVAAPTSGNASPATS